MYRIQYILEYERKKGYRKLEKPNTEIQFDGVMHLMHKRIITIAFVYIIFNLFYLQILHTNNDDISSIVVVLL